MSHRCDWVQLQFPCNGKTHGCLEPALHLNLVVVLQVIREAVNGGTQVMLQRRPCLLCTAKYVCLPMLSTYHWRCENINSKRHIPLTSPELLLLLCLSSSSPPYHHMLSQKKNF